MSTETFPILGRYERDMIENACWSSYKVPVVLVRFFVKLEFSGHIFEKHSNAKFHENPFSGTPRCSMQMDGWMDGWTDKWSLSQFCEGA